MRGFPIEIADLLIRAADYAGFLGARMTDEQAEWMGRAFYDSVDLDGRRRSMRAGEALCLLHMMVDDLLCESKTEAIIRLIHAIFAVCSRSQLDIDMVQMVPLRLDHLETLSEWYDFSRM